MGPHLCELHAHTCWSDGELTVAELVDLHGRNGFDVLCVTDHVVRSDDPWREQQGLLFGSVDERSWPEYLHEIEREAARSWRTYGMLVVPGAELTYNDDDPDEAAHAVAVGLRDFVSVDGGIAEAMRTGHRGRGRGHRGASAQPERWRARSEEAPDAALRTRRGTSRARPPIRALQSLAALRLGGGSRSPGGRRRGRPPYRARGRLEDAASDQAPRSRDRRVPQIRTARVPRAARCRALSRGRLSGR